MQWNQFQESRCASGGSFKRKVTSNEQKLSVLEYEITRLHNRIDGLALVCQALLETLQQSIRIDEDMIEKKMHEIDLRDGNVDGRMGEHANECPGCHRMVSRRHNACVYCGEDIQRDHLFERV